MQSRSECFVMFFNPPQPKQILIRRARLAPGGKQHKPSGVAINPMQRHKVDVVQSSLQS